MGLQSLSPQPKIDTLFARPYKGGQLEPVRAELFNDRLVVYRHDLVYEDILANNVSRAPAILDVDIKNYDAVFCFQEIVNERVVTLVREEAGIGISIRGGLDYKCPVKIYKVFDNSPGTCSNVLRGDMDHALCNGSGRQTSILSDMMHI